MTSPAKDVIVESRNQSVRRWWYATAPIKAAKAQNALNSDPIASRTREWALTPQESIVTRRAAHSLTKAKVAHTMEAIDERTSSNGICGQLKDLIVK